MVTLGNLTDGQSHTVTDDGDIHVTGSIDSKTTAVLKSNTGSIIIDGKVDGGSIATLTAAKAIRIGAAGSDDGQKKIDGTSMVSALAGGDISVGNKIDQTSHVTMTSTGGSITIGGKIDGGSTVNLTAAGNIVIGESGNTGDERKIDGNSNVVASAGGTIHLFNRIDGGTPPTITARWTSKHATASRSTTRSTADPSSVLPFMTAPSRSAIESEAAGRRFPSGHLEVFTSKTASTVTERRRLSIGSTTSHGANQDPRATTGETGRRPSAM